MATDHPRGTYSRELAKRKADQRAAPVFMYRYDWETPEGGGHMRSPHTIEIQFVFNNIQIAGPLISKMPEAYALADEPALRGQRLRAPAIRIRRSCRSGRPTPQPPAIRCCSTTSAGWSPIPIADRVSSWSKS